MKKKILPWLSRALVLTIVLSLLPFSAFAASKNTVWKLPNDSVKLLCIGDATANGSFLDGYSNANQGIGSNASSSSYPMQVYNELKSIYGQDKVTFTNYSFNTMRWSNLRMLLENSLGKTENLWSADSYDTNTLSAMTSAYNQAVQANTSYIGNSNAYPEESSKPAFYRAFKDAVTNADVITIDLGMNDFADCLQQLMVNYDNYESNSAKVSAFSNRTIGSIQSELDSIYGAGTATQVQTHVETTLAGINADVGTSVVDMVAYAYGSILLNYAKSLSYIYEVNPDVNVCITGMYNGIGTMNVNTGNGTVDAGQLWGNLVASMNAFLSGADSSLVKNPYASKIYFSNNENVSTLVTEFSKNISNYDPVSDYGTTGNESNDAKIDRFIDAVFSLNGEDTTTDINNALFGDYVKTFGKKAGIVMGKKEGKVTIAGELSIDLRNDIKAMVDNYGDEFIGYFLEGIKNNCCADKQNLTAADVKAAYKANTISDLGDKTDQLIKEISGNRTVTIGCATCLAMVSRLKSGNLKSDEKTRIKNVLQKKEYVIYAMVELFESIRSNMREASYYPNNSSLDLSSTTSVLSTGGNLTESLLSALVDFEGDDLDGNESYTTDYPEIVTTDGQRSTLALCVRGLSLRGLSTLPDSSGAGTKTQSMKNFLTGVSLDKTEIVLADGKTDTLTATVYPVNASNKNVNWESSDSNVVTVENGVVTAVGPGKATVTAKLASDSSKSISCSVKVVLVGDIDGNANVTLDDARLAKNLVMKVNQSEPTDHQKKAGDFNGDGKITINEVRKITRMATQTE